MKSNFDFIKDDCFEIYNVGIRAEKLFAENNLEATIKDLRELLEVLTDEIIEINELNIKNYKQKEKIDDLFRRDYINYEEKDGFHKIRMIGNRISHNSSNNKITEKETENYLKDSIYLVGWFYQEYINFQFTTKNMKYIKPIKIANSSIEVEKERSKRKELEEKFEKNKYEIEKKAKEELKKQEKLALEIERKLINERNKNQEAIEELRVRREKEEREKQEIEARKNANTFDGILYEGLVLHTKTGIPFKIETIDEEIYIRNSKDKVYDINIDALKIYLQKRNYHLTFGRYSYEPRIAKYINEQKEGIGIVEEVEIIVEKPIARKKVSKISNYENLRSNNTVRKNKETNNYRNLLYIGQVFYTKTGRPFEIVKIDNEIFVENSRGTSVRLNLNILEDYLRVRDFDDSRRHYSYEPAIARYIYQNS